MTQAWSPFGRGKRTQEPPKTRGRRRLHRQADLRGPGAVLTDRDAAAAAENAMQARTQPAAPAWERFASKPAAPRRQAGPDDRILRLADARREHCGQVVPADTRIAGEKLRASMPVHDYGTGPAYEPGRMS